MRDYVYRVSGLLVLVVDVSPYLFQEVIELQVIEPTHKAARRQTQWEGVAMALATMPVVTYLGSKTFASSAVDGARFARLAVSNLCSLCFCRVLQREEGREEGE